MADNSTYQSLMPGYKQDPQKMQEVQTKYVVKKSYYVFSGFFFLIILVLLPFFFHLNTTGAFADEATQDYRLYFIIFIAINALLSLASRLRASFCTICSSFRWPTQLDYNDYCKECGASLFHFHVYKVQEVAKADQDIDVTQRLIEVVKKGKIENINILLSKGANINGADKFGHTPLMSAALNNRPEIIGYLLNSGAAINATNNFGLTALMLAADKGKVEALEALLSQGADLTISSNDGRTALNIAQKHENVAIIQMLEEKSH